MTNNISIMIDDADISENENDDYTSIIDDINEKINDDSDNTKIIQDFAHYDTFYTVKDLTKICDYYGLTKSLKINKCKKEQIIYSIIFFENNFLNYDIVLKRKSMWFYMNELKSDPFMKKYIVLWN